MKSTTKIFLFGCFCFFICSASAQYISQDGRFQIDERKGCAPFQFTFTNLEAGECSAVRPCAIGYFLNGSTQFIEINANITTGSAIATLTDIGSYEFIANYGGQLVDNIIIEVRENNPPDFQVLACSNNDVRISVTENIYEQYVINFGDGSADQVINNISPILQHDYTAQGTYPISVRGRDLNAKDNCNSSTQNFNTFNTLPLVPINTLNTLDLNTIQLSFNTSPGLQFRLQIALNSNVNFQLLQNIIGDGQTVTMEVPNLNTENNYYCFRLGSYDPCTNTTSFGPVICSIRLSLQVDNNVNRLNWNIQQGGVNNYSINRNGAAFISNWPNTFLNDSDINCNEPYCYQVTANYTNGSRSTSIERCGVSFNNFTPPAINNLSVSAQNNAVQIDWLAPDNIDIPFYNVRRSINTGNFQVIQNVPTLSISDNQNPEENNLCYRVDYTEACGNESPAGITACVIQLSAEMGSDNIATLSWTAYNGWADGVLEYRLQKFNAQGQFLRSFTISAGTSFRDEINDPFNQKVIYVVTAIPNTSGLSNAVSNSVTILKEPNIYFPSAFTPNEDNLNDVFRVFGQYVNTFRIKIFNRWGELVYTSNRINEGWDGNFKGKPQPEGTYAFVCELTDEDGRNFTRAGSVVLFRKE